MKILLLSAALMIISSLILCSCKKDNPIPPGDQPQLNLTLEDTSCTEAWIKLSAANISLPAEVILRQDDSVTQVISLNSADTLLYINSLLPNHTYKFQSTIQANDQTSNPLSVTTMDTTSHNFTFETFTFGGTAGSSILYDVAIINENDIWAVGEIYIADSSQNGYTMYNAVHWDGNSWTTKRIQTIFRGNVITVPLTGVFTFSTTDIWMVGSLPIHGDGNNWIMYDLRTTVDPGLSLAKAWGKSTEDMYFVGNSGSIAHYQNGQWSRIESGTDMPFSDIYKYDNDEILISGADNSSIQGILLKGNAAQGFTEIIQSGIINESQLFSKLYGSLSSVWVDEKNTIYTGGNLLFQYKFRSWDYVRSLPENFINGNPNVYYRGFIISIRGNQSKDYWVVGDRNTIIHFNGYGWKQIGTPYDPMSFNRWRAVKVKNNICVVVGDSLNTAKIAYIKK